MMEEWAEAHQAHIQIAHRTIRARKGGLGDTSRLLTSGGEREDRLHSSLVRMFELQVKLEEEKKNKKNWRQKSSDLLSMFRRSLWGTENKEAAYNPETVRESRALKLPGKNTSLFCNLPQL